MVKKQNFVMQIQTSLLFMQKQMTFTTDDVETRFDTSNFEKDRPLPERKKKKIIGLIKDELGGPIMEEFAELRAKLYGYSKDNNYENKDAKCTKKCDKKKN